MLSLLSRKEEEDSIIVIYKGEGKVMTSEDHNSVFHPPARVITGLIDLTSRKGHLTRLNVLGSAFYHPALQINN